MLTCRVKTGMGCHLVLAQPHPGGLHVRRAVECDGCHNHGALAAVLNVDYVKAY